MEEGITIRLTRKDVKLFVPEDAFQFDVGYEDVLWTIRALSGKENHPGDFKRRLDILTFFEYSSYSKSYYTCKEISLATSIDHNIVGRILRQFKDRQIVETTKNDREYRLSARGIMYILLLRQFFIEEHADDVSTLEQFIRIKRMASDGMKLPQAARHLAFRAFFNALDELKELRKKETTEVVREHIDNLVTVLNEYWSSIRDDLIQNYGPEKAYEFILSEAGLELLRTLNRHDGMARLGSLARELDPYKAELFLRRISFEKLMKIIPEHYNGILIPTTSNEDLINTFLRSLKAPQKEKIIDIISTKQLQDGLLTDIEGLEEGVDIVETAKSFLQTRIFMLPMTLAEFVTDNTLADVAQNIYFSSILHVNEFIEIRPIQPGQFTYSAYELEVCIWTN